MRTFLIGCLFLLSVACAQAQTTNDYVGYNISNPVVGQVSHAQIWNPSDSGVTLKVYSLVAAFIAQTATPPGTRAGDITINTSAMALHNSGLSHNKDLAIAAVSKAQMNSANLSAGVGGGLTGVPPIHEIWNGATETDHTYIFSPPLSVPPGMGLSVRAAQPNMTAVTTWQWSEILP